MAVATAARVGFVKPMEALAVKKLLEGPAWSYELKLDGHRVQAISRGGHISLLSRRESSYTVQFSSVARALKGIADGTVIDGELTALDDRGRPQLALLQNHRISNK